MGKERGASDRTYANILIPQKKSERNENLFVWRSNYKSFSNPCLLISEFLSTAMIEIRQNKLWDCCVRVHQTADEKRFVFLLFFFSFFLFRLLGFSRFHNNIFSSFAPRVDGIIFCHFSSRCLARMR